MKATRAPATEGALLYHSMLIHVPTCPTSFHQLYSMMKLAMVLVRASRMSANSTGSRIRLRIREGRKIGMASHSVCHLLLAGISIFEFPSRRQYTKEYRLGVAFRGCRTILSASARSSRPASLEIRSPQLDSTCERSVLYRGRGSSKRVKVGIDTLAPHDLRTTCARLCHTAGGEPEQIQFLLGHVSANSEQPQRKIARAILSTVKYATRKRRYFLLSSILLWRKMPMRIPCTTSS